MTVGLVSRPIVFFSRAHMYQAAPRLVCLCIGLRRRVPALPLTLGVVTGGVLSWFLNVVWAGPIVAGLGMLVLMLTRRWAGELVAGVLLGLVSSLFISNERGAFVGASDVSFQGVVRDSLRRAKTGQVVFEMDAHMGGRDTLVRCRGVDLPWRNSAHLVPGATVWVRGSLEPVKKPLNPFSWEGWLWRRGVEAECKALFISRPVSNRFDVITRARESLRERSLELVDNERGVSLLLSMALGYRDVLSPSLEQAFSSLGLTHLLVVSGYQVSMVFGFVMTVAVMIVPRTSVFRYWREGCTALGLTVASVYVAFIGAEMSAARALIAAAFVCSERVCESRSGFAQRWCVALLLMQLLWPYCVFDIGVILTFAALAGIGVGATIGGKRKILTWIMVTSSVWAFTSVVLIAWSGSFSLCSIPLNLVLAAPWSALNCTIGLVSLLGALAGLPGASYALDLVVWGNSAISEVLTHIAQSPLAGWQLAEWRRWCACAALCALSVLLGIRAVEAKRREV